MKVFLFSLLLMLLVSCEKGIDIHTAIQEPLLVVDGSIENGHAPFVMLSTSINYFSNINLDLLASSIVSDAKVTLNDGTITSILKPYSQSIGAGYQLVYYTNDSANPSAAIFGTEGKTYTLSIDYNGKVYTSITKIPVTVKTLDSIWYKPAPHNPDSAKVVLMARVTDPPGFGDYSRYFTRINNQPFLPGAISVFDDQIVDGTTYDVQVDAGVNRNDKVGQDDYGFFHRGDTVTLKFASIDKPTYDFWRTLEFSYQSVGNPFSSPVKVLSNVSNGALGAFCGYGVQLKTIIIPN